MATVYVSASGYIYRVFHKSPECRQLKKKPARGKSSGIEAVDLNDLDNLSPCRTCYPDAPRARSAHRFCPECNHKVTRPCKHNGGVLVLKTLVCRRETIFSEVGDTWDKQAYVWPEHAHRYQGLHPQQ